MMREITDEAELREILGEPGSPALDKVRDRLHPLDARWLAASPFCLVATSAADGTCDVSPKGDPAGFTLVLDERTIAIPDRPGNRRADGFRNILANPRVGLLYVIPGRPDTLRINGRARLLSDADFFDRMVVRGHRPALAMMVEVEEVFHHCPKALMRGGLWTSATWQPDAVPSRAALCKEFERPQATMAELERHYGASYVQGLYGQAPTAGGRP